MSKKFNCLFLLAFLILSTGCETIKDTATGAATGISQDVQNIANPDKNGWNAVKKADAWFQQHAW